MAANRVEEIAVPPAAVTGVGPQADHVRGHIRGSALLLAGQVFALGAAFATQVLIVRYLSKTGYGIFAYALSVVAVVQTILTFGLNRSITRVVPIFHERGERVRASGAIALALTIIVAFGTSLTLVFLGLRGLLGDFLIDNRVAETVLVTLIVLAPIQALDDLMMNLFAIFNRVRSIFFRTYVLAPSLRLVAALVVIAVGGNVKTLAGAFVAAGAAGLLIYGTVLVRTLQSEHLLARIPSISDLPVRPLMAIALPLFMADLAYVVMTSGDAIILGHYRGATEVAAFKAVQPVARLNEIVFASFLMLFTPLAARLFARGDHNSIGDLYWQTAAWIAVISFPIFAATFALAHPVTVALFGDRYAASGTYLAILAVGFYVQAAFGFNGTTIMVYGRTVYIVALSLLAVGTNLALNLVLIPRYGALGAAIGTATALAVFNVAKQLGLWLVTGITPFDLKYGRVYATIAAGVGTLALLQRGLSLSLYPSLALVLLASLAILGANRRILRVGATFPELARLPLAGRLFGGTGNE